MHTETMKECLVPTVKHGKSARIGKNDQFATITVKNASGKNHQ